MTTFSNNLNISNMLNFECRNSIFRPHCHITMCAPFFFGGCWVSGLLDKKISASGETEIKNQQL